MGQVPCYVDQDKLDPFRPGMVRIRADRADLGGVRCWGHLRCGGGHLKLGVRFGRPEGFKFNFSFNLPEYQVSCSYPFKYQGKFEEKLRTMNP